MRFHFVLQHASRLGWRIKTAVMGGLVRAQVPVVGSGSKFFGRVTISGGENIRIGRNVNVGERVMLSAGGGTLAIDDGCTLLNGVEIDSSGTIRLGPGSTLNNDVAIKGAGVSFGEKVWVARNCIVEGADVRIADRIIFGPFVHVNDGIHRIDPRTGEILMEPGEFKPIRIGENAWIGSGAMILGGVTIGPGAIVGARNVVTKDVPAFCVVVGNPARIIKNRLTGEKERDEKQ